MSANRKRKEKDHTKAKEKVKEKEKEKRVSIKEKKEEVVPIEQPPPAEPVVEPIGRDAVLKELLMDLLSSVTTKRDIKNSFVRLTFASSSSYYGWLSGDGFNGFGNYTFPNGASFRGSFQGSLTKGFGRYTYADGNIYEGEVLGGCRHGYGTFKASRFQYTGHFKNNLFHGKGLWKSRKREEKGMFHEGSIVYGEVEDSSGVFKGTFDSLGLRKQGKFTFTNGSSYDGSWKAETYSGFGTYDWNEEGRTATKGRTEYVGYWLNGKRHGIGKLTFRHRCIICQWNQGEKLEAGIIIACNGCLYAGKEMFVENRYNGSNLVKLCRASQEILAEICQLVASDSPNETVEEKTGTLTRKIYELVDNHADWFSAVYPIRIPHYEMTRLPSGPYNTSLELKYLQQVVTENYTDLKELYKKYIYPTDDYMNVLGLNLFYMDVFHQVQDVNVAECMRANSLAIRQERTYSFDALSSAPLKAVVFYEFMQHFLRITELLMCNNELNLAAVRLRPKFFGYLATQVLCVLRILQKHVEPTYLVRDGIRYNRSAILELLQMVEKQSLGECSIRAAYRLLQEKGALSGTSDNFIESVGRHFKNVFQNGKLCEIDVDMSPLELIEVVLYACQLKLAEDDNKKNKQLSEMKRTILNKS